MKTRSSVGSPRGRRCPREHALTRWEILGCNGHTHWATTCAMRVGNRTCGHYEVTPPLGDRCGVPQ